MNYYFATVVSITVYPGMQTKGSSSDNKVIKFGKSSPNSLLCGRFSLALSLCAIVLTLQPICGCASGSFPLGDGLIWPALDPTLWERRIRPDSVLDTSNQIPSMRLSSLSPFVLAATLIPQSYAWGVVGMCRLFSKILFSLNVPRNGS